MANILSEKQIQHSVDLLLQRSDDYQHAVLSGILESAEQDIRLAFQNLPSANVMTETERKFLTGAFGEAVERAMASQEAFYREQDETSYRDYAAHTLFLDRFITLLGELQTKDIFEVVGQPPYLPPVGVDEELGAVPSKYPTLSHSLQRLAQESLLGIVFASGHYARFFGLGEAKSTIGIETSDASGQRKIIQFEVTNDRGHTLPNTLEDTYIPLGLAGDVVQGLTDRLQAVIGRYQKEAEGLADAYRAPVGKLLAAISEAENFRDVHRAFSNFDTYKVYHNADKAHPKRRERREKAADFLVAAEFEICDTIAEFVAQVVNGEIKTNAAGHTLVRRYFENYYNEITPTRLHELASESPIVLLPENAHQIYREERFTAEAIAKGYTLPDNVDNRTSFINFVGYAEGLSSQDEYQALANLPLAELFARGLNSLVENHILPCATFSQADAALYIMGIQLEDKVDEKLQGFILKELQSFSGRLAHEVLYNEYQAVQALGTDKGAAKE